VRLKRGEKGEKDVEDHHGGRGLKGEYLSAGHYTYPFFSWEKEAGSEKDDSGGGP